GRLAFHAAVPGVVVVGSIVVVLAVRLVVLAVVRDEIVQREAVVARDEVYAVVRRAAVVAVKIRRACEPPAEILELAGVAFLKATHGVAKAPVPLRPVHRKIADLIRANVPRLRDENRATNYRILRDRFEERTRRSKRTALLASEHRREIEPESVHAHRLDPVTQRVHDETNHRRAVE